MNWLFWTAFAALAVVWLCTDEDEDDRTIIAERDHPDAHY